MAGEYGAVTQRAISWTSERHRGKDNPEIATRQAKGSMQMKLVNAALWLALLLAPAPGSGAASAEEEVAGNHRPVKAIAEARLAVGNQGSLPLYLSSDWSKPLPGIARAVLVLHGRLRNAD